MGLGVSGQTPMGLPKIESQKQLQGVDNRNSVTSTPQNKIQNPVQDVPKDVKQDVKLSEPQRVNQQVQNVEPVHIGAKYKSWGRLKTFGNVLLQTSTTLLSLGFLKAKYSRSIQGFDLKVQLWGIPATFKNEHFNLSDRSNLIPKQQNNPIQPQQIDLSEVTKGGDENLKVRDRAPTNIADEGGDDREIRDRARTNIAKEGFDDGLEVETQGNFHQHIVKNSGLSDKLSLKDIALQLSQEIDGSTPDGSELDDAPQLNPQKSTEVVSYRSESDKLVQKMQNETPGGPPKESFLGGLDKVGGIGVENVVMDEIVNEMDKKTPDGSELDDSPQLVQKKSIEVVSHGTKGKQESGLQLQDPLLAMDKVMDDIVDGMETDSGIDKQRQRELQEQQDLELAMKLSRKVEQTGTPGKSTPQNPKVGFQQRSRNESIAYQKQVWNEFDKKGGKLDIEQMGNQLISGSLKTISGSDSAQDIVSKIMSNTRHRLGHGQEEFKLRFQSEARELFNQEKSKFDSNKLEQIESYLDNNLGQFKGLDKNMAMAILGVL